MKHKYKFYNFIYECLCFDNLNKKNKKIIEFGIEERRRQFLGRCCGTC